MNQTNIIFTRHLKTETPKFRINFEECITNVSRSIPKHFNRNHYHKTIEILDKILSEKNPKNIVLILFNGLGSRILDKTLNKDSFLSKNRTKQTTSAFPSTTAPSTLSAQTGLNPSEHGRSGWPNYIEPIDSTIQLFSDVGKGQKPRDEKNKESLKTKKNLSSPKRSVDIIKEKGFDTHSTSPYDEHKYNTSNQMSDVSKEKPSTKSDKKNSHTFTTKNPIQLCINTDAIHLRLKKKHQKQI